MKYIMNLMLVMVLFAVCMESAKGQEPVSAPAGKIAAGNNSASVPGLLKVVATVNDENIERQRLANACMEQYGQEVLGRLLSRYVLEQACKKAQITITDDEIKAEVEANAAKNGIPMDQLFKIYEERTGRTPKNYISDIVWPTLAVRKLVGREMAVTPEEIKIEYERRYGAALDARVITAKSEMEAFAIRSALLADKKVDVEEFSRYAIEKSIDHYTASLGGKVPPIRRHLNGQQFEDVVFALKPGEVSMPLQVGNQWLLVFCEAHVKAESGMTDELKGHLESLIREAKTRDAGLNLQKKMVENARVNIFFGDVAKSATRPGVAAEVDGKVISLDALGEECLQRYGRPVLEGLINLLIIQQEIKKRGITITEEDMNKEIERQALENLPPNADGKPDVAQWLDMIRKKEGATPEMYRRDVIWPTVALKYLVKGKVDVTQQDLQYSYEANFGKKICCRGILLNDMRTAQRIWGLAREKGSEENFIELAKKYSADAATRALGGELPPIAKHSGFPKLEEEAYKLQVGELSSIIQIGPTDYVILLCTGFTEPIGVTFDEAKPSLEKDVQFKKTQIAIGEEFQRISDAATVNNYLTGTTRSPAGAKVPVNSTQPVKGSVAP